jgi:O6-methylguanine-DNA--protein-cysteine methyltransferase
VRGMRGKVLALAVGLTGLLASAGCHGNGNSSSALTASQHKYCTLVKQFQKPTFPKNPEPEQFSAIMTDYVARNSKYFDQLLKVTPAEIKPDVEKAISTLRQVATGDISAYDGLNLEKADQWEEDHCNKQ